MKNSRISVQNYLPQFNLLRPVPGMSLIGKATVREMLSKQIEDDPNNRGGTKEKPAYAWRTVYIVEDPQQRKMESIGTFSLYQKADGTWVIIDAHSRRLGLLRAMANGNLTQAELNTVVKVCVYHELDKQEANQFLNSGQSITTVQKLKTPAYLTTQSVHALAQAAWGTQNFSFVSPTAEGKFMYRTLQTYIAFRDSVDTRKLSVTDIHASTSGEVGKLFIKDRSIKFGQPMVDASVYAKDVYVAAQRYCSTLSVPPAIIKKFRSEAAIYTVLLVDHLTKKEICSVSADEVGFRIASALKKNPSSNGKSSLLLEQAMLSTVGKLRTRSHATIAYSELLKLIIPNSHSALSAVTKAYARAKKLATREIAEEVDDTINTRLQLNRDAVLAAYKASPNLSQVALKFGVSATSIRRLISGK